MVEEGNVKIKNLMVPTLDFGRCKSKILYQKDLYFPPRGKPKKPEKMTDDEWELLDMKALGSFRLSLTSSVAFNISKEIMTIDLMVTLSKMYKKPFTSNKIFL